jgi:hypothetical protein
MHWLLGLLLLVGLGVLAIALCIVLFGVVHFGLQHLYLVHARRFCRRKGLTPVRSRSGTAFDGSGMKTEFTIVELDCQDAQGARKLVRLLVWIFGVHKVLDQEEPSPPPPLPAEILPTSIPYNPSVRCIVFFFGLGFVLSAGGYLLHSQLFQIIPLLFLPLAGLMYLRRTIWPRQIVLSETSITVPTGFLRLRPTSVRYDDITFVWVVGLGGRILCLQTSNRTLEIQDMFLPDRATFDLLKGHLDSFVQPPTWDETA